MTLYNEDPYPNKRRPDGPIGKQRALSLEVTCNFRLYLKIGQTSVKPS